MASRRMIASDIFEDDLMLSLDFFERLVWIGLFSVLADDQGRLLDSPALVRSRVFVYDNQITDFMVESALVKMTKMRKISRYTKAGKRLIQINNWWKYQTPAWASPSKYPAPEGWVDRIKYHTVGNKIVQANWDNIGGYVAGLHSGIEDVKDEGDVKGEDEVEVPPSSNSPSIQASTVYMTITGNMDIPAGQYEQIIPPIQSIIARLNGGSEDYLRSYFTEWTKRGYFKGNPGWLEWALAGEVPKQKNVKPVVKNPKPSEEYE